MGKVRQGVGTGRLTGGSLDRILAAEESGLSLPCIVNSSGNFPGPGYDARKAPGDDTVSGFVH